MKTYAHVFAWGLLAFSLFLAPLSADASAKVEAMLAEADAVRSSDTAKFQRLMRQLDASETEATPEQLEKLRYLHAYSSAYSGSWDRGAELARKLVETSTDVNMQYRAGALMVNSYASGGRFAEGLRQLDRMLPLTQSINDAELRLHGLAVAAQIYIQIGQYALGLHYAEQMLMEESLPARAQCFASQFQLRALLHLNKLPADDVIIAVIDHCAAQGEIVLANVVRGLLARKWADKGRHAEAIELINAHLAESNATRFPRLIGELQSLLAELLLARGDLAGADLHAQAAIAESASLANSPPLVAAHKARYEIASRRGDMAAALGHYRRFAEADKNHLNDVKTRELAYQIVRQEIQQKTQQIALLSQQNQVLQLQQRVQKQATQNLGLVVVLLTMLVAGIGYWAYKVKRLHLTLRRFAETDALTEISNRHHFTQQAQRSLEQCEMAGESASVIMFDLDRFKMINDTYGHDAGDWVLRHVATTCAGMCRRIDQLGRVGGEEFAILLHGCELNAAVRLAEDCRVRLSQTDTRDSGHTFAVTASFGVSSTAMSGYQLATLMSHADLMLYRAKRDGRNRVRAYRGDLPIASPRPVPYPADGSDVNAQVEAAVEAEVAELAVGPADERMLERRSS